VFFRQLLFFGKIPAAQELAMSAEQAAQSLQHVDSMQFIVLSA